MTTPVYEPPRGRNSYLAYVVSCAIGIAIVVWRYVDLLVHSIASGTVAVPVRIRETSAVPQPPGGATVTSDQLVLRAPIADVPGGAIGYIRVGDALEVLLVSALIALVAAVAWKISRGGLFDRSTTRILDWLAGAVLAAGFLPSFVRRMGWNWAVSGLGWDGYLPTPVVDHQFLPVYLGLLVVVCFRFALTASQRMVRDQAGLV
ncbi:hypothetical protein [Curtobacterium flaccumfaciens]|uniref:hypothetical protein n=1 Tax=Curtobacterium flaccumfaciens TaxID=2035 RepID=UPI000FFE347D|nr:hypothetical protein [Curtobacterium flaccumfaciens]MCS0644502.1 hypothetical protein [Curtobacterium flaccumfaciens pv. flaccumfaciens]MCS6525249.1 hypothetical protein [Curtobacterium flaccumfaciens pv. flaccumfaciens]MCS6530642.1 hypothetical protein [Curtobacterium flaccumfaciens pv. flaccumfaciens]NUU09609.1 hypothetical protein [Curtobacterium flaccumfaciens]RXF83812.1 hypothetical protein CffCFBP3418_09850 [Curtobacterium flaccumfaciens pv. flaccumfaciens]